jgi:hypothetical protein
MNTDWSEGTVQIQPLARKLEEHLNRREYQDAEDTADKLADLVFNLKRLCIKHQVWSGEGFR